MGGVDDAPIIGLLHPGEMGAAVGAALRAAGAAVLWASEGRSPATASRAAEADLEDVGTLAALAGRADVLLSICPPHAAEATALATTRAGFAGRYVDANAVAPATAARVGAIVAGAGATPVDGAIIGPPPRTPGTTRLYLSGPAAPATAELFAGTALEAIALDGAPTAASALKMAYAAWTKGRAALLLAADATARTLGVEAALTAEQARSQPDAADALAAARASAEAKGWRWVGEMEEIAATFAAAGQPDGFHRAAAEVFRHWG
jgi:hypothetical protein